MPDESLLVVPSRPLQRALSISVSQQQFQSLVPALTAPVMATAGVFDVGINGTFAPLRLKVVPYSHGQAAGQQFSMRLWAWLLAGGFAVDDVDWIPVLLAEWLCTVGDITGPPVGPSPGPGTTVTPTATRTVTDTHRFCDGMSLTTGMLGFDGLTNAPGPGLIAHAYCETFGAQKIQFDFAAEDGMANALWAFA